MSKVSGNPGRVVQKDELLDERWVEIGRLRSRVERAESAVGRVLAVCDGRETVRTAVVRDALAGTAA